MPSPRALQIFINVCSSDHVQEFSRKKVLQDDGSEEEVGTPSGPPCAQQARLIRSLCATLKGLNIPLSMGGACDDVDKSGAPCVVHDMIVNPGVLGDALGDRTGKQRHFLCELAIQCIHQKARRRLGAGIGGLSP